MAQSDRHAIAGPRASEQAAILSVLRDTVAIFTHDLSNPLQSITVLFELAEEDATTDEQRERIARALTACEAMRSMLREFSALARTGHGRDGARTVGEAMARANALLGRRFQRLNIELTADVERLAQVPFPRPEVEWVVIGLLLAALAAVRRGEHIEAHLSIVGHQVARRVTLAFSISALRSLNETLDVLAFDENRVRRLVPLAGACGVELAAAGDGGIDLSFEVREVDEAAGRSA